MLLNAGDGTFSKGPSLDGVGSSPYGVVAADLNGDGKPDLAVAAHGTGVSVMLDRCPH